MTIYLLQPLPTQKVMRAGALTDRADETVVVRVREADGVVAACAETPSYDFRSVELRL